MSSQNNEMNGFAIAFSMVAVALLIFMYVVVAIASFLALIFTILSLIAWNNSISIGSWVYTKEEARWFIYRGLIGTFMFPFFIVFCSILFDYPISEQFLIYSFPAGYVLGSVVFGVLLECWEEEENQSTVQTLNSPPAEYIEHEASRSSSRPFEYASWDDEQELK